MNDILDILTCPVCQGTLVREGKSLVCSGGAKRHTYDVSREGYVNLLPPGKEKNAHTGDDVEMVRARVRFLSSGIYDDISSEVARIISEHCENKTSPVIVDSGCGEGHHTCNFTKKLSERTERVLCAAFDASKHAAAAGAKRAYRSALAGKAGISDTFDGKAQTYFAAGNIFSLPVKSDSVDAVVSMFAPIAWQENLRILKKGGILVVTASGIDHLDEMRSVIYDEVIKKAPEVEAGEGFIPVARDSVRYAAELKSSDEIMDLFGMTPFYYKTSPKGIEKLSALEALSITVNADFFVFKKL